MITPAALSITDTASSSGIGRSTMYALIAAGQGPRVTKIRGRRVVLIEDRDQWLRSLAGQTASV
jgi:predicted DNA-binding transcriptional regulator AlpA